MSWTGQRSEGIYDFDAYHFFGWSQEYVGAGTCVFDVNQFFFENPTLLFFALLDGLNTPGSFLVQAQVTYFEDPNMHLSRLKTHRSADSLGAPQITELIPKTIFLSVSLVPHI